MSIGFLQFYKLVNKLFFQKLQPINHRLRLDPSETIKDCGKRALLRTASLA
jgi:hypothetical protein